MASNLPSTVFRQFLEYVEKYLARTCCKFDECQFDFRVRNKGANTVLDILFINYDECKRRHDILTYIDITNICFQDLTTCDWVDYLKTLAREFVARICPPEIDIIPLHNPCRKEPPRFCCFPITRTTIITKHVPPPCPKPETEVFVERSCECAPKCDHNICPEDHKLIIRYKNEKRQKCGEAHCYTKKVPEHDWRAKNGIIDYNDHIWNKPCHCRKPCVAGHLAVNRFCKERQVI